MVDILYEDNHIIVAHKFRGILSQADGSNKPDMLTILKDYIRKKYNKPGNVYLGLVHRLDINTEGVMVFARTSKAAERLSKSIQSHDFHKKYIATVEGTLTNTDFIMLKDNIVKDEKERKAYVREAGSESKLEYRALKNYKLNGFDVTDIDIILHTGRFHQIRCQMSNIGHPLYGDIKYGSVNHVKNEEFPLCAYYLEFPHPTTKELVHFSLKGE